MAMNITVFWNVTARSVLGIPYYFEFTMPSNLRCTPLLKKNFQGEKNWMIIRKE
jgi:hypothetical protein